MSIALGHPGGVRNILVVFAIRFGMGFRRDPPPTRRPSASVPASRGATSDDCASAEPAQRPRPAPTNSLLPMRFLIAVLLFSIAYPKRIAAGCQHALRLS